MLFSVFNGTEGNQTGKAKGTWMASRTLQASCAFYNGLSCRASVNGALQTLSALEGRPQRDGATSHVKRDLAALDGDDHAASVAMCRRAMDRSAIQASRG
jgi:hypothetical protein